MKRLKRFLGHMLFLPPAMLKLLLRSARLWWEFRVLRRQDLAIQICRDRDTTSPKKPRVLAVITHIVSEEDAASGNEVKTERMVRTLDGLLTSFAHCELEIVINTCPNRHLVRFLPGYLSSRLEILEQSGKDPMYIEFLVPDIFSARREDYDWFVFLEDDVVLQDSYVLEKLELFNQTANNPKLLLTPNRFEMLEGKKYYVDSLWPDFNEDKECAWNRFTLFSAGGVKFGECDKPHCAFYSLNRQQLDLWQKSGRRWNNEISYIGPLESAATGCLYEVFTLFKPHRANMHFFEVQHWDTKYSRIVVERTQAAHAKV